MSRLTGQRLAAAAAAWSLLDLILHVAIDQVEAPRVAGDVVTVIAGVLAAVLGSRRISSYLCLAAAGVHASLAAVWIVVNGGAQPPAIILITVALILLVTAGVQLRPPALDRTAGPWWERWRLPTAAVVVTTLAVSGLGVYQVLMGSPKAQMYDGRLVGADYFTPDPEILSAGLGFDGTIGVSALTEDGIREAGGSWAADLDCADTETVTPQRRTGAPLADGIDQGFLVRDGVDIFHGDGLPVVFSWPVVSDTVDPEQFRLTLSNGDVIVPDGAGLLPNFELNERQTVVLIGDLGNRETGDDAIAPVRLDIVEPEGGEPLLLAGPDGDVDATGLSKKINGTGYDRGPTLVAAKLTRVDPKVAGEGGVFGAVSGAMPNDEVSLYGDEAQYRLRMLTTGGFSPDGVRGLTPSSFENYFRLEATGLDGTTVRIKKAGVTYTVEGGTVRVVGLSDLGRKPGGDIVEDDCYQEDRDNQIDIVLAGDEEAMASITTLEMPGLEGGYSALYNPGGPGPTPFDGVTYTKPSPPLVLPVTNALDMAMQVDRD